MRGRNPRGSGSPDRGGNIILVATFLCVLALLGTSSFFFLTRTDVTTSVNLAREISATYLAESVAEQIESRINRRPWEERPWLVAAAAVPQMTFTEDSGLVDLSLDPLPSDAYSLAGIVKDLDSGLKTYRIYLEVTLEEEVYSYAWDKRFDQSVIDGMNRDSSLLDKKLEESTVNTEPTDELLDEVKERAIEVQENSIQAQFRELLDRLRTDTDVVEGAATLPPEPEGSPPVLPSPPPG